MGGWCGSCCVSNAGVEGNHNQPILAMLDWFYPRCARIGRCCSVAQVRLLGSVDRLPPAGADKR